jgi:mono/diheme cytochrome c family protein
MRLSLRTVKLAVTGLALLALAQALLVTLPTRAGAAMDGAEAAYKAKCATCHGADGAGKTPMGQKLGLRDLRSPEVQKQSDAQLNAIIGKGKEKMPGFEKSLGADQVKQLVAYVRELGKKR